MTERLPKIGILTREVAFMRRRAVAEVPRYFPAGTLVVLVEFVTPSLPYLVCPVEDSTYDRVYSDIESYIRWLSPLELLAVQLDWPGVEAGGGEEQGLST